MPQRMWDIHGKSEDAEGHDDGGGGGGNESSVCGSRSRSFGRRVEIKCDRFAKVGNLSKKYLHEVVEL